MRHGWLPGLLLCCAAVDAAEIYRWVDTSGQVHYGQVPPPGQRAEKLQATGAPPGDNDTAARLQGYLDARQSEREAATATAAEAAARQQQSQALCQQARERLQKLEQRPASRQRMQDAQGGITRMSEAEYARRQAEAAEQIKAHCAPTP